MRETIFVDSLKNVDFSEMKFPIVVLYDHPADFPGDYIARVYDIRNGKVIPTNVAIRHKDLRELKEDVFCSGFQTFIPRSEEDARCIIGSCWR